jgi:hypothetical protein
VKRAWLVVCVACACGADVGGRAVATLSTSPEAGSAFADLRVAFEHDTHDAALAGRFDAFMKRFPRDKTTPLARLYLGHIDLDMHDTEGGQRALASSREPPPGNEHDFWLALRARLLIRQKRADDALALLQPLVGTVVDVPLRTMLLEEVAVASIDARRSLEAVAYLDGWLRAVPAHEHKSAHDRVAEQLHRIDPNVLKQTLEAMQGEDAGGYSTELQRMVAEALAKHALDAQDTHLAQRLIDSTLAKYLTGSVVGQDLRDLATSLRGARAVVARTIGLVLPTDTPELRDAAADAARGAAFALGLPRAQGEDDGTHLVTRADTSATLDASLEELAGAGAAVVLAGIDETSADHACRWAEENGLPVITLSAPRTAAPTRFCFVAGESRQASFTLLLGELEKRAGPGSGKSHKKVAFVTGASADVAAVSMKSLSLELLAPFRCEPPFSRSRLPLADWTAQSVHAFVVSAPSGCVRTLLMNLDPGSDVGLALESNASEDMHTTRGIHAFAVAPVATPHVDEYKQKLGSSPSYWTAIGRDAALLAHAAESDLPVDRATGATEITRRREQARSGLVSAKATLWTTDATGFGTDHKLPRTLRILDIP